MRALLAFLLLLALIAFLPVSELVAKREFDRFCEENVGAIPSSKIVADGVELRRGFELMPANWPDGLEYLEFSAVHVIDGSLFEDATKPNLLSPGVYQIRFYDQVGQECFLYTEVNFGKIFESEEQAAAYFGGRPCRGIAKVGSLQTEYYAEHLRVDNFDTEFFATILGRGVRGSSFRVYRRSDNAVIGSSDSYSMDAFPLIPKPEFLPGRYQCSTDRKPPYELGLNNFFE